MHETFDYYLTCRLRSRNKGLFTADQVCIIVLTNNNNNKIIILFNFSNATECERTQCSLYPSKS